MSARRLVNQGNSPVALARPRVNAKPMCKTLRPCGLRPFSDAPRSCILNGEGVLPAGLRVPLPFHLRTRPGTATKPAIPSADLAPLAAYWRSCPGGSFQVTHSQVPLAQTVVGKALLPP